MDSTRKTFVLLSFWFLLLSCATPQHERFTKLKIGVDKTQALDIVGSPNFSERRNGQDEWTYVYYKNNELLSKRLFF